MSDSAGGRRRRRQDRFLPYLLLSPALVLLAAMIYPFGLGLHCSFTSDWLQYPNRFRFVWLDNYVSLVEESLFARALEFTLSRSSCSTSGSASTTRMPA